MKTQANAKAMRAMAKSYREFFARRVSQGESPTIDNVLGAAVSAADALEDLAETRDDLRDALNAWERWVEQEHRRDPDWPGYAHARSKIDELRSKHFVIGSG